MVATATQCNNLVFSPQTGTFDEACIKGLVSTLLGIAIPLGALGLKLPQIFAIVSSGNVAGLSAIAMYNEVPLVLTSVAYNVLQGNPFSTYGENFFILVQNIVLVLLLWNYTKSITGGTKLMLISAFAAICAVSFSLPPEFQYLLPMSNLPLLLASRVPQMWANFQQQSTGQLSFISLFLSFAGALARIFTTIHEIGWDMALLSTYLAGATTTGVMLLQIVYYKFIAVKLAGKDESTQDSKKKR